MPNIDWIVARRHLTLLSGARIAPRVDGEFDVLFSPDSPQVSVSLEEAK